MTTPPPPPPSEPPTVGMPAPAPEPVGEWWRKGGPVPPPPPVDLTKTPAPVYTPIPIGAAQAVTMEAAAEAFWAPAGKLFAEQASAIASQVGETIGQLLTETEAQRSARQQVEYETLLAAQRARMDAALGQVGETEQEKAERHRVEDLFTPDRPSHRDDLIGFADLLADRIGESPEERAVRRETERELEKQRARVREDQLRAAAGETPAQRDLRHRQQRLTDQREVKARIRRERRRAARAAGPSIRVRRFRRWCTLTAISAVGGYSVGLVTLVAQGGPYAGLLLAGAGWALDLHLRDRGRLRVSEVRRPGPLLILIATRVPVASGLAVAAGLDHIFAFLPLY